jgi:septal ring factor EnvC (AmiA/AmiB activator)
MMRRAAVPALIIALATATGSQWRGASATEAEQAEATDGLGELRSGEAAPDERMAARQAELEAIRRTIEVSQRRQESLRAELEGVESDRAKLGAELIATAQRMRRTETRSALSKPGSTSCTPIRMGFAGSLRERRA